MDWQRKIAEEFNRSFNEPFMPEGFCVAKTSGDRLFIKLGDRDVAFDEDGDAIGSGSNVGSTVEWLIERRKTKLPDVIDEEE